MRHPKAIYDNKSVQGTIARTKPLGNLQCTCAASMRFYTCATELPLTTLLPLLLPPICSGGGGKPRTDLWGVSYVETRESSCEQA